MHYTEGIMESRFQEIIRREAVRQGLSGYRIAKMAGLPLRTAQAYMSGSTDLAGRRIEKIAEALGLELKPKAKAKRAKKVAR